MANSICFFFNNEKIETESKKIAKRSLTLVLIIFDILFSSVFMAFMMWNNVIAFLFQLEIRISIESDATFQSATKQSLYEFAEKNVFWLLLIDRSLLFPGIDWFFERKIKQKLSCRSINSSPTLSHHISNRKLHFIKLPKPNFSSNFIVIGILYRFLHINGCCLSSASV